MHKHYISNNTLSGKSIYQKLSTFCLLIMTQMCVRSGNVGFQLNGEEFPSLSGKHIPKNCKNRRHSKNQDPEKQAWTKTPTSSETLLSKNVSSPSCSNPEEQFPNHSLVRSLTPTRWTWPTKPRDDSPITAPRTLYNTNLSDSGINIETDNPNMGNWSDTDSEAYPSLPEHINLVRNGLPKIKVEPLNTENSKESNNSADEGNQISDRVLNLFDHLYNSTSPSLLTVVNLNNPADLLFYSGIDLRGYNPIYTKYSVIYYPKLLHETLLLLFEAYKARTGDTQALQETIANCNIVEIDKNNSSKTYIEVKIIEKPTYLVKYLVRKFRTQPGVSRLISEMYREVKKNSGNFFLKQRSIRLHK